MVLLTTSVFLVQLLCVLVPCNPKYPLPQLEPQTQCVGRSLKQSSLSKFSETIKNLWESKKKEVTRGPIVATIGGLVQGYIMKVVGAREVAAFEGIPYGLPPVGQLRFRAPLPAKGWSGILPALQSPAPCLQYNVPKGFRILGKEDCLYLNVYSPKINPDLAAGSLLPVLFYIHGGGFFFGGSSIYGPSYLLQKDVVLVVAQYRLGILGFMSSGDAISPGNYGLKDQLLALQWVASNIASFGGDPSSVTLIGQSAGSAMVHFHLLSSASRPYFSRAISLSGSAFNYWALHSPPEARNYSQTLAKLVGCDASQSVAMVECLRKTNPVILLQQTQFFLDDWPYPSNAWRPCVETEEEGSFLNDFPLNLYAKGDVAKVPWIVTLVSGEGYEFLLFPYVTLQFSRLQQNWASLAPDLADIDTYGQLLDLKRITAKLEKFYFHPKIPPKVAPVGNFANIVTDRFFLMGIYKAAQAHSKLAPTYSYIFDVNGQYNQIQNFGYPREEWGVGHAEDLFYIFNSTVMYHGFRKEDLEFEISQFMIGLLTNFAETGKPGDGIWQPHKGPSCLRFLKIEKKGAEMIDDPFRRRIKFWDSLQIPDTPQEDEILA